MLGLCESSYIDNLALQFAATYRSGFSPQSIENELLVREVSALLVAVLPKALFSDPQLVANLQSYMLGQLQKVAYQRVSSGVASELLIGKAVSAVSSLLAQAVGNAIETKYGLSEDSWQVTSATLAVHIAIDAYSGGRKYGAVGAIAGTIDAAVGEIIVSTAKSADAIHATAQAFEAGERSAEDLRQLADQIGATDPARAARLRGLADQADAETQRLREELQSNPISKLFSGIF